MFAVRRASLAIWLLGKGQKGLETESEFHGATCVCFGTMTCTLFPVFTRCFHGVFSFWVGRALLVSMDVLVVGEEPGCEAGLSEQSSVQY